ncbi:MAG: VOC family protein [Proteobacteria bacterium]|jgi:catechol 2,3-dioxygenase-like lactoylglutathione lyase family enzyme|nr:VOC family protein [Pseudomonadota bacterium]
MNNVDNNGRMISAALDVGVVPRDIDAMLAFYADGLGMQRLKDIELPGTSLARVKAGRGILKFNQGAMVPEQSPSDVTESRGMKLFTIIVPDLQSTSERLQKAGFSGLSIEDRGQYTLAFTRDPDNTLVELAGYPGFGEGAVLQAVALTVGDVDATRSFLSGVLGFAEGKSEEVPSMGTTKFEFAAGATTLKVWQIDGLLAETGPVQAYSGIRYLTAEVDNIDAVLTRARDAGRNIPIEPLDIVPGVKIAMVEDPDGNWFELLERT